MKADKSMRVNVVGHVRGEESVLMLSALMRTGGVRMASVTVG